MSQIVEGRRKGFVASGALGRALRVKLSGGQLALAGIYDIAIGTMEYPTFAAGDIGTVNLFSAQGTQLMQASGAITQGATVYNDVSGQITATPQGEALGIALEAAGDSGGGDLIEVMVFRGLRVAFGSTTTVTASDTIVTGLGTLITVIASLDSAPVLTCDRASGAIGNQTGAPAAGSFYLQTWMPTSNSNPTPIAATTFSKIANWIAIGT